jgi:hypothetical protein
MRIDNPVVIIHERDNNDSYVVSITNGSHDHRDAVVMELVELDVTEGDADTWGNTGYYMAAEIKRLHDALKFCGENDGTTALPAPIKVKTLAITLPDTSSKAFWSGTGKGEVFHPETYKRWVKQAIERASVIAGLDVRVK